MNDANLIIDPEFQHLIPALKEEERQRLEENIRRDGCRDPLVVWKGKRIAVGGHNRFEICTRLGIEFKTVEIELDDRDSAKLWILNDQLGRRNLLPIQRAKLALELKPLLEAQAKANQGSRTDISQNSVKSVDTQKELAKISGLSHDTIHKTEVILKHGSESLKADLNAGKTSINAGYQAIKHLKPGKPRRARSHHVSPRVTQPQTPYEIALEDAVLARMKTIAETFQTMGASDV